MPGARGQSTPRSHTPRAERYAATPRIPVSDMPPTSEASLRPRRVTGLGQTSITSACASVASASLPRSGPTRTHVRRHSSPTPGWSAPPAAAVRSDPLSVAPHGQPPHLLVCPPAGVGLVERLPDRIAQGPLNRDELVVMQGGQIGRVVFRLDDLPRHDRPPFRREVPTSVRKSLSNPRANHGNTWANRMSPIGKRLRGCGVKPPSRKMDAAQRAAGPRDARRAARGAALEQRAGPPWSGARGALERRAGGGSGARED
jgi:hypothetical protein